MEQRSKTAVTVDVVEKVPTDEKQGRREVLAQAEETAQGLSGESGESPDSAEGAETAAKMQSKGFPDGGAREEGQEGDVNTSAAPGVAKTGGGEKSEPLSKDQEGIDATDSEQQGLSGDVSDRAIIEENAGQRDPEQVEKGNAEVPINTEDLEVKEQKGEGVTEVEAVAGEVNDEGEELEVEIASQENTSEDASGQDKKEAEDEEVTQKAGASDQGEENTSQEKTDAGSEGERKEAEPLSAVKETEKPSDEEDRSLSVGFFDSWPKRIHSKWFIPGSGVFLLLLLAAGVFLVPYLTSTGGEGMYSLESIAGPVYDMKFFLPFTENSGKTRFIKLTVAFELMEEGLRKDIEQKSSEVRKEIIEVVLAKSLDEVKSSNGKELLKKEITSCLNERLTNRIIRNTYFTEFVVL